MKETSAEQQRDPAHGREVLEEVPTASKKEEKESPSDARVGTLWRLVRDLADGSARGAPPARIRATYADAVTSLRSAPSSSTTSTRCPCSTVSSSGARCAPRLGVRAFGVNAYTARAAGDLVVEEHDERGTGSGHQRGALRRRRGARALHDRRREVDAPAGACVFLPDPAVTARRSRSSRPPRSSRSARRSASRIACRRGGASSAPPAHATAGDWERAAAVTAEGLPDHADNAALLYNLACFEARAGRLDDAMWAPAGGGRRRPRARRPVGRRRPRPDALATGGLPAP